MVSVVLLPWVRVSPRTSSSIREAACVIEFGNLDRALNLLRPWCILHCTVYNLELASSFSLIKRHIYSVVNILTKGERFASFVSVDPDGLMFLRESIKSK